MPSNMKLSKNIGITLFRHIGTTGILLLYSILLARSMGKADYGTFTIVILFPQLLAKLSNLGFGSALVYFLARNEISFKKAQKIVFELWIILGVSGLLIGFAIFMIWGESLFPNIPRFLLQYSLATFPLLLIQELLPYLLLGINDLKRFNLAFISLPIINLVVVGLFFFLLDVDPLIAIIAFSVGHSFSILINIGLIHYAPIPKEYEAWEVGVGWKQILAYAWKIHLSNIVGFLNYRVDMFIVNFLASPAAAGMYFVAVQIGEKLWMLSHAVNTAVFPHLIGSYKKSSTQNNTTVMIGSITFTLTAIASLILAFIAPYLIAALFGLEYREAAKALILLLPGIVASSVGRVLSNDFAARGKPEINFYVGILTVGINISANWVWIPIYGIGGAALATSLSYCIGVTIKLFVIERYSGIKFYKYLFPDYRVFNLIGKIFRDLRAH